MFQPKLDMEENMNIRRMMVQDAEAVMMMWNDAVVEIGYQLSESSQQQILVNLQAYAEHEQCACFVAEVNGKLVGYITCAMTSHPIEPGYGGDIEELYVQPTYRTQRIDESLLNHAVVFLKSLGAKVIMTRVDKENKLSCDFWDSQKWNQEMIIYAIYSDPDDEAEQAVWDRF